MNAISETPLLSLKLRFEGRNLDLDLISNVTGLTPTSTWHQKDPTLDSREDMNNTAWSYGYDKRPYYNINDAMRAFLGQLEPYRERIQRYLALGFAKPIIACEVVVMVDAPSYELSAGVMQAMVELSAGFTLEILDYRRE